MTTEAARYTFTAADAVRALGMPEHPDLAGIHICILLAKNGASVVQRGSTAEAASDNADTVLNTLEAYAVLERQTLSPQLRDAIRLERAGLPMGRTDVNPTQVPALAVAPDEYTMARSVKVPLDDGLVDPEHVAKAWGTIQTEVAAADPPFPAALQGYTFEPTWDGDDTLSAPTEAILTVYG